MEFKTCKKTYSKYAHTKMYLLPLRTSLRNEQALQDSLLSRRRGIIKINQKKNKINNLSLQRKAKIERHYALTSVGIKITSLCVGFVR